MRAARISSCLTILAILGIGAPRWTQYVWFLVVLLLAVVSQVVLVAAFLAQRAKRRRAEHALLLRDTALRRSSERIGQLAGRLIDAQETVRTHIARDLHDDVAQRLSLLAIDLSMLQLQVDQLPSSAQQRIGEMSSRAAEIGSDLHRLSHDLHPALLEELGLEAAIRSFCRELSNARHLDIDLRVRDLPHPVTPDVALCIYRVVQEALHNVARHSGAPSASVAIERTGDDLILSVIDHGAGFDVHEAHEKESLGLRSIEERVNSRRHRCPSDCTGARSCIRPRPSERRSPAPLLRLCKSSGRVHEATEPRQTLHK